MEIYFVFFFPPAKQKKKSHPHCTHCQSHTSQRSNQSFAKECNLAPRRYVDKFVRNLMTLFFDLV
jgi:hypothetical protein